MQATEADSGAQDALLPLKRPSSVQTAQISTGQEDLGERRREPPCIKTEGSVALHRVLSSFCHPGELEEDAEEKPQLLLSSHRELFFVIPSLRYFYEKLFLLL